MSISRRWLVGLVAALVLWTALATLVTTVMEGGYVCSILTPTTDANGQQLTQAEMDKLTRERCDRGPSLGGILLFGTGYVVIVAGFLARADRPSDRSRDDPLVPGG